MSDAEVRRLAGTFRRDRFPLDVIWLDIDYQDHNRPFTVNKTTFPDMPALVRDMGQSGIKLVPITDLHIAYLPNQGYAPYDSGVAGNNFVHDANGKLYVAPVWPGPSVFPDFTRASTRAWWGSLYKDFIADGFGRYAMWRSVIRTSLMPFAPMSARARHVRESRAVDREGAVLILVVDVEPDRVEREAVAAERSDKLPHLGVAHVAPARLLVAERPRGASGAFAGKVGVAAHDVAHGRASNQIVIDRPVDRADP